MYNSPFLLSTNSVAYYLQSVESILSAGAELAIAKLLVGKVVGASKCGSGLLVDCGGKKLGTDGHRVTALMYTHVAHAVSATAMCTGEKNLAAINVREKFLSSTL